MPSELGLHPALQSFINNFTAMKRLRRTEDLDEKRDKQQEIDNKLREAKFKEEMKQHQDEIDHRNEVLKMTQQMQHLQARKTVGDLVRGGSLKPNDNSGNDSQVSVPGQLPKPDLYNVGGYQFNTSEVGSPQEQGQAQLEYNAPVLQEKARQVKELHDADSVSRMAQALMTARERATQEAQRQEFTSKENDKKIKSNEGIAQGRNNAVIQGANIRASASKKNSAVGNSSPDVPSYWNTVATGQAPIDNISTTKNERAKATEHAVTNGIGYYTKQDESNAKPLVKVLGDYKKMKDFVDNLRDKDPANDSAAALMRRGKYSNQGFATLGGAGKTYRQYNTEIVPAVAAFGRTVGEKGAFTEKDAAKYKAAMVGPHQSDEDNYETLKFMYDGAVKATKAQFPNIKADKIDQFLESKYKITPPEKMDFTPGMKLKKLEVIDGVTYLLQPNGKYKPLAKAEGGK